MMCALDGLGIRARIAGGRNEVVGTTGWTVSVCPSGAFLGEEREARGERSDSVARERVPVVERRRSWFGSVRGAAMEARGSRVCTEKPSRQL